MTDSDIKRIHECVKRTLIFESGKKLDRPVCLCFVNGLNVENCCSVNHSRSEENIPADFRSLEGTNCYGCSFSKCFLYFSEALEFIKDMYLISFQKEMIQSIDDNVRTYRNYWEDSARRLLHDLIIKTRSRCYLTFSDSAKASTQRIVEGMRCPDLFKTITKICEFCKENNIK